MMKRYLKKLAKDIALFIYRIQVKLLPVDRKMIFFESNVGRNYTGNPRYIYEEMVRQGLDKTYHCYYVFENTKTKIPGAAKKIKRLSPSYFYILARAGVWISDTRLPAYAVKRGKTKYIQTWHGTPLKKLALDMERIFMAGESDLLAYKRNFSENSKTWDYLISQNSFSTAIFKRAFAFDKKILEIGYPRNDILLQEKEGTYEKIKTELGLPPDKKVMLYAPTWRDNEQSGKESYRFNPKMDFQKMQEALSGEYIMLVKYHYLVKDKLDWSLYKGFVYEFDESRDISQLYLAADLLITDYSSVMFDYSLLGRPMFFFVYDLDEYRNNLRGFYFDLTKEAPGPLSLTTEELIQQVKNINPLEYAEKYRLFVQKYNHADHGSASRKVVDLITGIIEGNGE